MNAARRSEGRGVQNLTERGNLPSDFARRSAAVIINKFRPLLSAPVPTSAYLSSVAAKYPSHEFLGQSAQAVFQRQVALLEKILTGVAGRETRDLHVLDWGCGKGQIAYLLRQRGFAVTACDRNDPSEDSAFGQKTPIIAEQGIEVVPLEDNVRLPFHDEAFDCVTSFGVLEHVPHDQASMQEIRRVLRPGGIFFITFLPYRSSWTQAVARLRGNTYHDRLYRRRQLLDMAENSRFGVAAMWLAQLFPKNSVALTLDPVLEPLDRFLCRYTPLKFIATNLEAVLVAE